MKTKSDSFFIEPLDPRAEARELALEVVCRLLIWMADAPTLDDRGLRTSVALYCVRPDLIDGATLERIGDMAGRTRQAVHKLADSFRLTTGFETAQRYMQLARSEADVSSLRAMSLRQTYSRLGIATEPKSHANRAPVGKLPAHVRMAHQLVVVLKPCAQLRQVTPKQCAAYRQDCGHFTICCDRSLKPARRASHFIPPLLKARHEPAAPRAQIRRPLSTTRASDRRECDRGAVPATLPALGRAPALAARRPQPRRQIAHAIRYDRDRPVTSHHEQIF